MRAGLVLAAGLLCGCTPAAVHEHELRVALPIDPTSLSPLVAFSQDQIALDQYWCQTLIGLDERNRFIPILTTRVPSRANGDVSGDGLRITYHLRRNVRFADGVPFTSADVAFTYRAILDPANAAPSIEPYQRIRSLETPDAATVRIRLRAPWSAAVHELFAQADEAYGILPKHAFATSKVTGSVWESQPFGTGPFRVRTWRRGDTIELEPNPFFAPAPKLAHVRVRIVPNAAAAFNALRAGEIDIAELSPDNLQTATTIGRLRIARTPVNGLRALYLQTATRPTDDPRVRRAIADALDLRSLAKSWRDVYPPARSIFPAPLVTWRAVEPPGYARDPEVAGRELDAAGWRLHGTRRTKNGQPLVIDTAISTVSPEIARIAVGVQAQLARLGVDVAIKAYSATQYTAPEGPLRSGRFALSPGRYIGGSDPEQSVNLICSQARNGGDNYSRYCSPEVEALLRVQRLARDDRTRERAFDAIAGLIRTDVPIIPLYDLLYIEGIDKRVRGYRRNMLYFPVHPEQWDMP